MALTRCHDGPSGAAMRGTGTEDNQAVPVSAQATSLGMDGDVDANSQIDERELEEKDEKHVIEFDLNVGKKKATQQKGKGSRGPRITEEEKNLTLSLHRFVLATRFALTVVAGHISPFCCCIFRIGSPSRKIQS